MRTITRTEITVETRQVMVVHRQGNMVQNWCAQCGAKAGMIRLEEAVLAGLSLREIRHKIEADRLHLVEVADGLHFICLNSLLK
jgi:hypothetical protein